LCNRCSDEIGAILCHAHHHTWIKTASVSSTGDHGTCLNGGEKVFHRMIGRLVIDSSDMQSELCTMGRVVRTDKSPYNTVAHRHPYTAVYTMLFASFKNKPIKFAEIGVAMGASAALWDGYFAHEDTQIKMFDRDENFLENAARLTGSRVSYSLMDVEKDGDVRRALLDSSLEPYDVILDDSSHNFDHQIRIVKEAFPLLKQGGLLIVEDIFRSTEEDKYSAALADVLYECSTAYFVVCEHKHRWSPGWDNDKLLVLVKA